MSLKDKNIPNKVGRPTTFTQDVMDSICDTIATSNKSLRTIALEHGFEVITILRKLQSDDKFCTQYARAKEAQADFLAEEILTIADDSINDTKTIYDKAGNQIEVENTEWVNRSKLRVDARKWIASKLKPKKYGERIDVQQTIIEQPPLFPDVPKDDSSQ